MRFAEKSPDTILTIRDFTPEFARLTRQVRRNFAWYDEMLSVADYDRDHDPARLPLIDEALLTEHYYEADHPHLTGCAVFHTSGTSTGARKKILYSPQDDAQYVNRRREIFSRFLSPDCRTACSDLGTGHAASSAEQIFRALGLEYFHIDFRRPVEEHVKLLNRHQPDILFTMPMILERIIHGGNLRFNPKKIITVGDIASQAWKQSIVAYFGLERSDLLDVVGSIEVGSIAYECFDCGCYHFDEHIIPETFKPSELYEGFEHPGDAEILVLTSLSRSVFPAVRFVTNDLIEGFKTRECGGREVFVFEKIVGRAGSELKNGEKISLYDINEAVNTYLSGSRFEVQKDDGRIVIRVCSPGYTAELAAQIKSHIKKLNPDVAQMIASSLAEDIEIRRATIDELSAGAAKRSFLIKKENAN